MNKKKDKTFEKALKICNKFKIKTIKNRDKECRQLKKDLTIARAEANANLNTAKQYGEQWKVTDTEWRRNFNGMCFKNHQNYCAFLDAKKKLEELNEFFPALWNLLNSRITRN